MMSIAFLSQTKYRPFTPTANILWDPLWNLKVSLTPCERELLNTWGLRRLGFIHTFGAGGLMMPTHHSRLSHVQGVFALVAHFQPDNELLRLAALLHDVGHGPFSHSSEILPDFDHHQAGREIIFGPEIGGLLRQYGFDPAQIVALTEGQPPNPIRTQNGLLHLDHLDFFVRDPFACGWHIPSPTDLLSRLYLDGSNVATDLTTAEHLVERILFEHHLFTSPIKVATEAVLGRLFVLASQKKIFNTDLPNIVTMTDADLLSKLAQANDPEIDIWLKRLLHRPHTLTVRRVAPNESLLTEALVTRFDQSYLNQPLVEGQPVSQLSRRAASMLTEGQALLGSFIVEVSD